MKTEAQRSFRHGFLLDEQELRRVLDTLVEQVIKADALCVPIIKFEIRFLNGAVSETPLIDEVLSLENFGTASIDRLLIVVQNKDVNPSIETLIKFNRADRDEVSWEAVQYTIKGEDRDWVFVASSKIEERISKIKSMAFGQVFSKRYSSMLLLLLTLPGLIIIFFTIIHKPNTGYALEKLYNAGQIKDPIAAMIYVEKSRQAADSATVFMPFVMCALPVAIFIVVPLLSYMFPAYNFYWGDYIRLYNRRKGIRSFVLVVLIISLLVGIVAGAVVNKFRLGLG